MLQPCQASPTTSLGGPQRLYYPRRWLKRHRRPGLCRLRRGNPGPVFDQGWPRLSRHLGQRRYPCRPDHRFLRQQFQHPAFRYRRQPRPRDQEKLVFNLALWNAGSRAAWVAGGRSVCLERLCRPGYCVPKSELARRSLLARTEGILLDPVYSGKAAGLIDLSVRAASRRAKMSFRSHRRAPGAVCVHQTAARVGEGRRLLSAVTTERWGGQRVRRLDTGMKPV